MADICTVPLVALSSQSKFILSTLLNPTKCIPSEDGYQRDWRGVAELFSFGAESIPAIASKSDPISFLLDIVIQKYPTRVIKDLQEILEKIGRWDVVDDTQPVFEKDAQEYHERMERTKTSAVVIANNVENKTLTVDDVYRVNAGLSPQHYDAFLLFAEEDSDFAQEIIDNLEQKQNLKLFVKDRDLVTGIVFEHTAMMKLISERCNRLIVVLSPNFLNSTANDFLVKYAQAIGIEQGTRKIIPCLYKKCQVPDELKFTSLLIYDKSKEYNKFWERLSKSVETVTSAAYKSNLMNTKCKEIEAKVPEIQNIPTLTRVLEPEIKLLPATPKQTSKFFKGKKQGKKTTTKALESDDSQNDLIKQLPSLENMGLDSLESSSTHVESTSVKLKKSKNIKACAEKLRSFVIKKS